jgi:hypothetical protein
MGPKQSLFIAAMVLLIAGCSPGGLGNQPALPPVTVEFRYRLPGAGEAVLVWGVNGWGPVSEELQPPRTTIKDRLMNTPMTREGDTFILRVMVPAWSTLNYGFFITRLADGTEVQPLWDGSEDYQKPVYQRDDVVDISSAMDLGSAQALGTPAETAAIPPVPVSRQIRFTHLEAGEVVLVWGIDGWQPVADWMRPGGTVVNDAVMQTIMVNNHGVFSMEVWVPTGSTLDYGFLIRKNRQSQPVQVWEGGEEDGFHELVNGAGVSEVHSEIPLRPANAFPSAALVGLYLVAGILLILMIGFLFRRR